MEKSTLSGSLDFRTTGCSRSLSWNTLSASVRLVAKVFGVLLHGKFHSYIWGAGVDAFVALTHEPYLQTLVAPTLIMVQFCLWQLRNGNLRLQEQTATSQYVPWIWSFSETCAAASSFLRPRLRLSLAATVDGWSPSGCRAPLKREEGRRRSSSINP